MKIGGRAKTIQITALLRSARILRRVLVIRGDFLSLVLQWKTISLRYCEKFARSSSSCIIMIIIIIIIVIIIMMMMIIIIFIMIFKKEKDPDNYCLLKSWPACLSTENVFPQHQSTLIQPYGLLLAVERHPPFVHFLLLWKIIEYHSAPPFCFCHLWRHIPTCLSNLRWLVRHIRTVYLTWLAAISACAFLTAVGVRVLSTSKRTSMVYALGGAGYLSVNRFKIFVP